MDYMIEAGFEYPELADRAKGRITKELGSARLLEEEHRKKYTLFDRISGKNDIENIFSPSYIVNKPEKRKGQCRILCDEKDADRAKSLLHSLGGYNVKARKFDRIPPGK